MSAAEAKKATGPDEKSDSWVSRFLGVQGLATFVVFFAIFVFLSITSPSFLTAENLIGLLRQVAMLMIASVGMTFLIIGGGIDLSIGSSNAVTGVVCALAVVRLGLPVAAGILAGILCGGALGLLNGLMVTQVRLPPLLATLGMMVALRGGAFLITGGHTIYGVPNEYLWIGRGYVGFIPVPVLIMLAIFLVYLFLQRRSRFGLYMYAIGGDRVASRRAGINDRLYTILAYVNTGLLVGLSGVIASSRFGAALPNAGLNFEMDVITAVVIGGTSIFGGLGRLGGTLLGVLIIGMITNGMLLLNIHSYWQQVAKGLILIIAVGAETIKQKKED